jgi:hypothetical protein
LTHGPSYWSNNISAELSKRLLFMLIMEYG